MKMFVSELTSRGDVSSVAEKRRGINLRCFLGSLVSNFFRYFHSFVLVYPTVPDVLVFFRSASCCLRLGLESAIEVEGFARFLSQYQVVRSTASKARASMCVSAGVLT